MRDGARTLLRAALVAVLALLLFGCGWGPGPSSDPDSLDAELRREMRMQKRERGAAKMSQRDAEENLKRLNPMGGG